MRTEKKFVLAAAPSAGKTVMSIALIDAYLTENPGAKVLVLAHAQRVLRSQYADEIALMNPDFTSHELEQGVKLMTYYDKVDVVIAIPQTLQFLQNENEQDITFDLIVVDEAHQHYLAPVSQKILASVRSKIEFLLTASPSPFVLRKYTIIAFPLFDLPEDLMSDTALDVFSSEYDYDLQDFNVDHELKQAIGKREDTPEKTRLTLDNIVHEIAHIINKEKTIYACRSQMQAMQVFSYFKGLGVNVLLSISNIDETSEEVFKFKSDSEAEVLVVVGRGILGFNYPELINFIDMTGSQNIDRIFQMYARLSRVHPEKKNKRFIKIVPKRLVTFYWTIMDASMLLANGDWLLRYNGKNFLHLPLSQRIDGGSKSVSNGKPARTKTKMPIRTKPICYAGMPVRKIFKLLAVENPIDRALTGYLTTTILEARAIVTGERVKPSYAYLTEEEVLAKVIEEAKIKHGIIK